MSKKQQLIIPEKMKKVVHPNLLKRNGEISDCWREDIPCDWLHDVKEPKVSTKEIMELKKETLKGVNDFFDRLQQKALGELQKSLDNEINGNFQSKPKT